MQYINHDYTAIRWLVGPYPGRWWVGCYFWYSEESYRNRKRRYFHHNGSILPSLQNFRILARI